MPKGGARVRSGPPPDPQALRRERDSGTWVTLPAAGRLGETPEWPLTRARQRELVIWEGLWSKPQAVEWERLGQEQEVALYVRCLIDAEKTGATAAARTIARQFADSIGLTSAGLARNKWRIVSTAPVQNEHGAAEVESIDQARRRLRVVAADEVEGS